MDRPPLLSIPEAAKRSGVSRSTIYRIIDAGHLPRVKLAGRVLIDPTDLERLIQSQKGA